MKISRFYLVTANLRNFQTTTEDIVLEEWELEQYSIKDLDPEEASLLIQKTADDLKEEKLNLRAQKRQERKARLEILKNARIYEMLLPSNFGKVLLRSRKLTQYYVDKMHDTDYEEPVTLIEDELDETNSKQLDYRSSTLKKERVFSRKSKMRRTLTIRIKPNNVFCTLKNEIDNKVISGSSTKYKIKMSKKTLRYNYKIVVRSFLEEAKKMLKSNSILVNVTSPKRVRKELLRILKKKLLLKQKSSSKNTDDEEKQKFDAVVFNFNAKKCFNGCRAKKKRRNKQRGLRIYK